jgi:hypothetical protein
VVRVLVDAACIDCSLNTLERARLFCCNALAGLAIQRWCRRAWALISKYADIDRCNATAPCAMEQHSLAFFRTSNAGGFTSEVNTSQGNRSKFTLRSNTCDVHVAAWQSWRLAVHMCKCHADAELYLHLVQGYRSNGA